MKRTPTNTPGAGGSRRWLGRVMGGGGGPSRRGTQPAGIQPCSGWGGEGEGTQPAGHPAGVSRRWLGMVSPFQPSPAQPSPTQPSPAQSSPAQPRRAGHPVQASHGHAQPSPTTILHAVLHRRRLRGCLRIQYTSMACHWWSNRCSIFITKTYIRRIGIRLFALTNTHGP